MAEGRRLSSVAAGTACVGSGPDGDEGGAPSPRHVVDVTGRDDEAAVVASFLDRCACRGGALLVTGEPGMGKTVVLEAASRAASAAGALVLRAAGAEFEADMAYSGLHQLLLPVAETLDSLPTVHRSALTAALGRSEGPPAHRFLVATAVLELLRRRATTGPVLLVVDDLRWVDRSSVVVLGFLARRLDGSRIGMLAAHRGEDESVVADAVGETLDLAPLEDTAAARLACGRHPGLASRSRRRLLREARGNPLALVELPRGLSGAQLRAHDALPARLPLSPRLRAAFAPPVAALPRRTRRLLLLAALDERHEGTALGRVGSGDTSGTEDHWAPARRARLVTVDPATRRPVFAHPLIRSVVVDLCTDTERRAAHRSLAARPGTSAEQRAEHLAEAARGPDEDLAALLEQAADRAMRRGEADRSVADLLRSADLSPPGPERARRLAVAAHVGAEVGGAVTAVPALLRRAHDADPGFRAGTTLEVVLASAHRLLHGDGDVDTAHHLLVTALDTVAPDRVSGRVLDAAVQTLALACRSGGRAELWGPFRAVVHRCRAHLSPVSTGPATADGSGPAGARALGETESVVAGLRGETDPLRIVPRATAGVLVDRLGPGRDALLRLVHDGRRTGALTSTIQGLLLLAVDDVVRGRWEEAQDALDECADLCAELGYPLLAAAGGQVQALLAAARGDGDRLRRLDAELRRWALPRDVLSVRGVLGRAHGLAALGRRDYEAAYRHLTTVAGPGSFPAHEPSTLEGVMDLVEAAVRTGRHAAARAHVDAAHELGLAGVSARIALLVAGATALAASGDAAGDLFDAALAIAGPARAPFDRARVQLAYGQHLRRARKPTHAARHLGEALEVFDALRAQPWADRARAERDAGGGVSRAWTADAAGGTTALTSQQWEIAMLAASGLTNRQIGQRLFLSHRTVGAHLYRIFPKLAVTSRAGLRDALTRADVTV